MKVRFSGIIKGVWPDENYMVNAGVLIEAKPSDEDECVWMCGLIRRGRRTWYSGFVPEAAVMSAFGERFAMSLAGYYLPY